MRAGRGSDGPTIITIATWPVLTVVYYRLARREEHEAEMLFGEAYSRYKASVPMFVRRVGFRWPAEPSPSQRPVN